MKTPPKQDRTPNQRASSKDNLAPTSKARPYLVGYGKPPIETRFKEGNNANPKGRPVGAKSQATILNEQLHKKITVTDNGVKTRITTLQAIIMTQVRSSLKGNQKSTEFLLKYHRQTEEGLTIEQMDSEDKQALEYLLNEEIKKREKAKK